MSAPLDDSYLTWLYAQVGSVKLRTPSKTYWSLFRQLFTKEFVWIIPNDDNRVEDGKELRYEFLNQTEAIDVDEEWLELGCSFLELLIGLSRRLSFEADGNPRDWFWTLIRNLGLADCTDSQHSNFDAIDEVLNGVIWRTYSRDGRGGLFPLEFPDHDQRDIEIWYQLSAYVLEQN